MESNEQNRLTDTEKRLTAVRGGMGLWGWVKIGEGIKLKKHKTLIDNRHQYGDYQRERGLEAERRGYGEWNKW